MENSIRLDSVEAAIEDIRNGKVVIIVDDENRENEGEYYFPFLIFFINNTKGILIFNFKRSKSNTDLSLLARTVLKQQLKTSEMARL